MAFFFFFFFLTLVCWCIELVSGEFLSVSVWVRVSV